MDYDSVLCGFCFVVSAFAAFGVRILQLYSHIGSIARPKWQRMNIYKLSVVCYFCCVASVVKSVSSCLGTTWDHCLPECNMQRITH